MECYILSNHLFIFLTNRLCRNPHLLIFWTVTGRYGGGRYGGGHYGGKRYGGGRYGRAYQFRVDATAEPPDKQILTLRHYHGRYGGLGLGLGLAFRLRLRLRLWLRVRVRLGLALGLGFCRSSAVPSMVICEYLVAPP